MEERQIAVVTGGNRGLGFATSAELARQGYHVILTARSQDKADEAARALEGLSVEGAELDVADEASIKKFSAWLEKRVKQVDVLVNNAGVFLDGRSRAGLSVDRQTILETFETNTLGPFLLTRELVPLLRKAKFPRVVNVSSTMGQLAEMGPGSLAYRLSKTALNSVTKVLAKELANDEIRVNAVCPGWVKTDMGGEGAPKSLSEGIDTIVWAATSNEASGGFFRDRKEIAW